MEFLRENAHLRPRSNTFGSMFRLRNAATMGVHDYFQKNDFIQIHTPILNSNDCEGAGDLFVVKSKQELSSSNKDTFFSVPEFYLTVSGQLEAEIFASVCQ